MKRHLIFFLLIISVDSYAQFGVQLNTDEATQGYALIALENRAALIDNCGEVVHDWDNIPSARFHYKLLPNGNLVYVGDRSVHELDWDGNLINRFDVAGINLQYEVEILPNGNFLCVGRVGTTDDMADSLGFDLTVLSPTLLDVVVEVDRNTGEKVWEWKIHDHMIQERDQTKANYGVVNDHPELLDIGAISDYDWQWDETFMINSMDYNAELDQIVLSIRKMSEFVIIDHSTTTEEAAGSTGGRYGKGGDILYRWGNPQNYGQGTADDQQLYHQHNPNWIEEGPYKGYIGVYNNGLSRPAQSSQDRYSSADFINTQVQNDGTYVVNSDGRFEPYEAELRYNKNTSLDFNFYSGYLSGATILENGNIWITVGGREQILELNPEGDLIWYYRYDARVQCFRTVKYPLDYPAFEGRDLTPMGPLESFNDYECNLISSTQDPQLIQSLDFEYRDDLKEIWLNPEHGDLFGQLHDVNGRTIQKDNIPNGVSIIPVSTKSPGIYIYTIIQKEYNITATYKIVIL